MAFQKIDSAALRNRGATSLPNKPTIQTEKLKSEFDAPSKEVIAPVVNKLVEDLNASSAASSVGAEPLTGRVSSKNVQAVLQKLSDDLEVVENNSSQSSHSHTNKDVLDALSRTDDSHLAFNGNKIPYSEEVVIDDAYRHTDNNFTDELLNKLDGIEIGANNYSLPTASTTTKGGVKVDGTTIVITNGVISAPDSGGGGGAADAFKTVKVGAISVTASGEDTFTLKGGTNVTLSADAGTKEITINSTGGGGGSSTGDMLKSVYDPNNRGYVETAQTLYGLTASTNELNYLDGATSNIQTQLDNKLEADDVYSKTEIDTKLLGKVSTVTGKGLSTNDYTSADKTEVGKIANKVDKVTGKGLSTNDYTNEDVSAVSTLKTAFSQNKILTDVNYTSSDKAIVDSVNGLVGAWTGVIEGNRGDTEITFQNVPPVAPSGTYELVVDPYFSNGSGTNPKNWVMTENHTNRTVTISFDALDTDTNFKLHYFIQQ